MSDVMTALKRWEWNADYMPCDCSMEPASDGDYVRFSDVEQLVERLEAEREGLRESSLDMLVEFAAGELPADYSIEIQLEYGSGSIDLTGPDGELMESGPVDETFSQALRQFVRVAKEQAAEAGGVTCPGKP